MPARSQRRGRPIRARVTWEEVGVGQGSLEICEDHFTLFTRKYCRECGKQGIWSNGDSDHCTGCGTVLRLTQEPEPGEGFNVGSGHRWVITRQLQLAEAAAA